MTLAVERRLDFDLRELIADEMERGRSILEKSVNATHSRVQHEWVFLRNEKLKDFLQVNRVRYRLKVDDTVLLEAADSGISLNIKHSAIDGIEFRVNFQAIAGKYPTLCRYVDGVFSIPKRVHGFSISNTSGADPLVYLPVSLFKLHALNAEQDSINEETLAGEDAADEMRKALAEISEIVSGLTAATCAYPFYNPRLVPASRRIPTQEDLTFQLQGSGYNSDPPLTDCGLSEYRPLAKSALENWLNQFSPLTSPQAKASDLFLGVNAALSNHLFLEKGYRISCSVRALLSERATEMQMSRTDHEFAFLNTENFLVELKLRDNRGRVHRIEDVGSGIGYVLPVLESIYGGPGPGSTSIIQQPELHLHPALQAALADTLLDGSAHGNHVVVETHSEYLILRILRRVRQTHLGVEIANELRIDPEQVCIMYFDPKPTGETEVKRLRISEDGEFMDRWPRGFFAERDQELFDE